mgnify:CR=1 FL=1
MPESKKVDLSRLFLHFFFILLRVRQGRTSASTCLKYLVCVARKDNYVCQSLHVGDLQSDAVGTEYGDQGMNADDVMAPANHIHWLI